MDLPPDSALVAEIYNVSHPVGFSYGDVEYYAAALAGMSAPVLELACGTGRVLLPLLSAGLDMEGLDISGAMLDMCRANARERGLEPTLHRADMAGFSLPRRYGAVIIPSGSTKELAGTRGLADMMRCCHACLLPGGRLVFDVAPPRMPAPDGDFRCWSRGATLYTRQRVHTTYDGVADRSTQYLRYEKWHENRLVAAELHPLRIHHLTPDEVRRTLEANGFQLVDSCGDYEKGRALGPRDNDWTFCAVAEDPTGATSSTWEVSRS